MSRELASETVRLKPLNNSVNKFGQLMQRYSDRFSFERSFAENYLDGHLKLLTDFDVTFAGDRGARYRCNTFPSYPDRTRADRDRSSRIKTNESLTSMLVQNIKVMQASERIVPSIVRLERPKNSNDIWSGPVYVSVFDGTLKSGRIITEGEMNIFGTTAILPNKVASEMIKRGSEIMNSISNNPRPRIRNVLFWNYACENILPGISETTSDKNVRVAFEKRSDCDVQIRDVAVGPINL
jgi:hypothetical protein